MPVYSGRSIFKRWLRWRPEHPEIRPEDAVRAVDRSLKEAKYQDDEGHGTGEWVALLSFGQGAKMCASLVYRHQFRMKALGRHFAGSNYRFGVLLAERVPLISLDPLRTPTPRLLDASQITYVNGSNRPTLRNEGHIYVYQHFLCMEPLIMDWTYIVSCMENSPRFTAGLIECDGDHRVPLKSKDVSLVAGQIRELVKQTRVYQKLHR